MPVAGAIVLWLVTGSAFALWFAALGPLLAVAALFDGRRTARRARRRAEADDDRVFADLHRAVTQRHEAERRERRSRHLDVAAYLAVQREIWRVVPQRSEALAVGIGVASSAVRLDGEATSERARELRAEASRVRDVPVLVPRECGVAVTGPPALAAGVVRALALQVCLAAPPGQVRIADDGAPVPGLSGPVGLVGLPHAAATSGRLLFCGEGGRAVPDEADIVIVRVDEGTPPPPRCAAVITVDGDLTARVDHAGSSQDVRFEAVSATQAARIAALLRDRAAATLGGERLRRRALAELLADAQPGPGLAAPLGEDDGRAFVVDLVADGPHAVVVGATGSGKSELLTTWITAICHAYGPDRVALLLVDFKGGRTFDALEPLPHVTGVLTDLDEAAAVRAIESLRSEVRRREAALAACGARDIDEADGALPRLVIVVDEYAALTAAHPVLHDLFGDIAARGRALGMHLVLASQRATGAFRDAVLANAPLRIGLRVADAADSRVVLGSDAAVRLSARADARGTALVQRVADASPRHVQVPLCTPETIEVAADRHTGPPAVPPWLPPLPLRLPLTEIAHPGAVVLGLVDEPERQRQRPAELGETGLAVVGAVGSGKTAALRAIAAQCEEPLWVPGDPEQAWDAIADLDHVPAGTVVLLDDADAVLARMGGDHALQAAERLAQCVREARSRGVRIAASWARAGAALSRVSDLLPDRLLLALPTRADHVAAGGEGIHHDASLPPGRGRWRGRLLQVAWTEESAPTDVPERIAWRPGRRPVALVAPAGPATMRTLTGWGITAHRVGDPAAALTGAVVVYGAPDEWLAQWRLLAQARAEADLVVDATCATEHRAITGARDLSPFALAGARRAWLHRPGAARARRIVLPG